MTLPLFSPGQGVSFTRAVHFRAAGAFNVVRALHSDDGRIQYRVRSKDEAFDRIADESSIEALKV